CWPYFGLLVLSSKNYFCIIATHSPSLHQTRNSTKPIYHSAQGLRIYTNLTTLTTIRELAGGSLSALRTLISLVDHDCSLEFYDSGRVLFVAFRLDGNYADVRI